MSQELKWRQKAIRLKEAGWKVNWICQLSGAGAAGLRDRSHAPKRKRRIWLQEMRQSILQVRDRLMQRHGPRQRYRLAGAPRIRHELACPGYDPLPSLRTIERILQRGERTSPAFRVQPCASSSAYPVARTRRSNQSHHMDLIGPRYLKGSRRQWFFLADRDIYDGAVFVKF